MRSVGHSIIWPADDEVKGDFFRRVAEGKSEGSRESKLSLAKG